MAIPYDPRNPDFEAVRAIFFDWLRTHTGSLQLSTTGEGYEPFVEYTGPRDPQVLAFHVVEVFWQMLVEGIVAPGMNSSNMELPWFHVTAYGRTVLEHGAGHPHDPSGYLARLRSRIDNPDETVIAYLTESLATFRRGTVVAAAVMLGIAAERVFVLVCQSLLAALADQNEKDALGKLLERFPMKPKLDWVQAKITELHNRRVVGFPEGTTLMVTAIYDLLRSQRNDLGHPRDLPPQVDREHVFASFQVFARFYKTAEELRQFLKATAV